MASPTRPKVLVLGAAQHQLFALRTIAAMGCEVIAIDRNPEAPGFAVADRHFAVDIADAEAATEVARACAIDAVVPLSDFGVRTASAVSQALGLPGLPREVAWRATSKAGMRRAWEAAGVPSARFRVVSTIEEAERAVAELETWPLIVKPADSRGGGSRGVSRIDGPQQLAAAVAFAQSFYPDPEVVVEEFLEGVEHSLELVVNRGTATVLAISDKEKTPAPYRVDKSVIYPTACSPAAVQDIVDVATRAVAAVGIELGAVHVELCTTAEGARMFELGARFGGGHTPDPIVRFVAGVDEVRAVTEILLGGDPGPLEPHAPRGCVYRFLTPEPGLLEAVEGLDTVRAWEGVLDCGVWVAPGSEIRPVRTGGDRAGYVVTGASDRAGALALADAAEAAIRFRCA